MYPNKYPFNIKNTVLAFGSASLLALAGCSGSTDGGEAGDTNFAGEQFVADEESTGSISLNVTNTRFPVGSVVGFSATVRNRDGVGVEGIRLSCDSELGVAITEPSTGSEITDSSGSISGSIGCAAPGSYRFGCRLPVGAAKREIVTINCEGPVPTGFAGFPGAAGGGLGLGSGGIDNDTDAGPGGVDTAQGVQIISLALLDTGDLGASGSASVDTTKGVCVTEDPDDVDPPEPFFDTYIRITVRNNSSSAIQFSGYSYVIQNGSIKSGSIGFLGASAVGPNGKEEGLISVFAPVSGTASGQKSFIGQSTPIGSLGFTNYTVTLIGTNDLGDQITVKASSIATFDNFNRCTS